MTAATLPFPGLQPARRTAIRRWLIVCAIMVLLIVVIGGVTRLTESGLSITEWAPVTGVVPPLSQEGWTEAFEAYQRIPEYQQLNQGMTLAEFKQIYFWEYLHRLWARLVGLAFVVPFVVFLARGGLPRPLTWRLLTLVLLTGAQGALGWFMVASGLADRTDVSQYRLAAHLALALVIYALTVWTVADLGGGAERRNSGNSAGRSEDLRRLSGLFLGLVFLTAVAGAFVAGLDGGRAYNTFPLMGGQVIPGGYGALDPWWRNLFENVAAVQFNHRLLGVACVVYATTLWLWGRGRAPDGRVRVVLGLTALAAVGQVLLGITTLLLVVPIPVAALHQAGAVVLLTAALLLHHALRSASLPTAPVPAAA